MTMGFDSRFRHPEPGPEASSGSIDFGISVLGLEKLGFKAPLWAGFFTISEGTSSIHSGHLIKWKVD